jgi:hypothetical protein
MSDERLNEKLFWEFGVPGQPQTITLEHGGVTETQAASFLIGQGALQSRACACCGGATPINGTRVRLVRQWGQYYRYDELGEVTEWVPASTVEGEWRTWPLSRKSGGN